jgi:hypothetical protein
MAEKETATPETNDAPSFSDLEAAKEQSVQEAIAWTENYATKFEEFRNFLLAFESEVGSRIASPSSHEFPQELTEAFESRKVKSIVGTCIEKTGALKESLEASLEQFHIELANKADDEDEGDGQLNLGDSE